MARRVAGVSEAQFNILLDLMERHPNLARARGYNNSAQGRSESMRLWMEVAVVLNAGSGSGTSKTPKEWFTNLQQPTSPAMPQTLHIDEEEVQEVVVIVTEDMLNIASRTPTNVESTSGNTAEAGTSQADTSVPNTNQADTAVPSTSPAGTSVRSRRPWQTRYCSCPLAPLDEAWRILSQVVVVTDAANACSIHLAAQNIGRLADAAQKYLFHMGFS